MARLHQLLATALLAGLAGGAQAADYAFACITNNSAAACADGAANLSMDVTDAGGGWVDFTFRNLSALGSAVTEIYFDDGTLLGIAALFDSGSGVTFSQVGSAAPPNLPGGEQVDPPFQVTQGFAADTGSGGNAKGVENKLDGGVQEFVTVRFELLGGQTFADTLAALNGPLGDGSDLRVGLHVRGFAGASSEAFVNAMPVPEPGNWSLMLSGLAAAGLMVRRRRS